MDFVAGALGSVIGKLGKLLHAEYKLHKGLSEQIESLKHELESSQTAIHKVGEVRPEELDPQVRLWAREVREASYDMEDILDTFLVNVVEVAAPAENKDDLLKRFKKKMAKLFKKSKARHTISGAIVDMKKRLQEVADRRDRFSVAVALPAPPTKPDPRLADMHKEAAQLIGMDKTKAELIAMLQPTSHVHGDSDASGSSSSKMKIVSVVGVGGLGKTTLARAVYEELEQEQRYHCGAFVSVGRNPDLVQVFTKIFFLLDINEDEDIRGLNILDLLIEKLRKFLQNKRYFIVIDDVWDITTWQTIKSALVQTNSGSRVIITTRIREVASEEEVYELDPLSSDDSKRLFYIRLFGGEGKCPANHPAKESEKILYKCGCVPLAIITMASLLVGKSREDWFDVCNSPGFYRGKGNQQVADDTECVLSLSYYDLPSHLKTCLLYLSVYPEDYFIEKDLLIWKWIAEGFVQKKTKSSLFQQGEEYFNQLINRSMIQAVESERTGIIYGCYVHDMMLDLIRGLSDTENFVTISTDDEGISSSRNKVRRLAYQNRMVKQTQQDDHMGMAQVRSLVACSCDIESFILDPCSFKLLRVLALEKCENGTSWQGLQHLGSLLLLRYLGLRGSFGIQELPEEIGKLKLLQALDLEGCSNIGVLPRGVCQLTQLLCLRGGFRTCTPEGFLRKVTSLEELRICSAEESLQQFVKDLGNLREARLRVLEIHGSLGGMVQEDLVQSLGKLGMLQHLQLGNRFCGNEAACQEWDTVVLPQHLRHLDLHVIQFHRLPSWISPMHLSSLYYLWLCVDGMDEAGLRALGGLPELRYLRLSTELRCCELSTEEPTSCTATVANIIVGDVFFPKLRRCELNGWMVQLVVNDEDSTSVSFTILKGKQGAMAFGCSKTQDNEGSTSVTPLFKRRKGSVAPPPVMPNLQHLEFMFPVGGCSNLRMECIPSLRKVDVCVICEGASKDDVKKTEAELRRAAQLHPNRPVINISLLNYDEESDDGDDLSTEKDEGDEACHTESPSC